MSSIVPNIEKRAKMLNILANKSIYLSSSSHATMRVTRQDSVCGVVVHPALVSGT